MTAVALVALGLFVAILTLVLVGQHSRSRGRHVANGGSDGGYPFSGGGGSDCAPGDSSSGSAGGAGSDSAPGDSSSGCDGGGGDGGGGGGD
jgi:hypothetical protein